MAEEEIIHVCEGMQGDAMLRDESEIRISRIVEESGSEEATGSRDESGGGALGLLGSDEAAIEYAAGMGDSGGGVSVDVDVVEATVAAAEEDLPERGEVEVGVGEEEEGDLGAGSGFGGDGVEGGESGAAEEGDVVELVGEGDLEVFRRRDDEEEGEEEKE